MERASIQRGWQQCFVQYQDIVYEYQHTILFLDQAILLHPEIYAIRNDYAGPAGRAGIYADYWADVDTHTDTYANADTYAHVDADSHANTYAHANSNSDAYADPETYSGTRKRTGFQWEFRLCERKLERCVWREFHRRQHVCEQYDS
jgi:hypothetical protein